MSERTAIVTDAGEWRVVQNGRVIARLDTFDPFSPDAETLANEIAGYPDRIEELEARCNKLQQEKEKIYDVSQNSLDQLEGFFEEWRLDFAALQNDSKFLKWMRDPENGFHSLVCMAEEEYEALTGDEDD